MLHKAALLNQVVACTVEHKYDFSSSLTRGTALSSHNCHSGLQKWLEGEKKSHVTEQQQTVRPCRYLHIEPLSG